MPTIHWPWAAFAKASAATLHLHAYCLQGPCLAVEAPAAPCAASVCRTEHGKTYLPGGGVIALEQLNRDVDWQLRAPPAKDYWGKKPDTLGVNYEDEGRPWADCKGSVAVKAFMLHQLGVSYDRMTAMEVDYPGGGHMVLLVDGKVLDSRSPWIQKASDYDAIKAKTWPARQIVQWTGIDPHDYDRKAFAEGYSPMTSVLVEEASAPTVTAHAGAPTLAAQTIAPPAGR